METLKIIPYYTGKKTLKEIYSDKKSKDILWLEILLNDTVDWEKELIHEEGKKSYEKARIWYSSFKTMIENYIGRKPLQPLNGTIDKREYRKFIEAIHFVSA